MFFGGVFHGLIGFGFPMLVTPALSLFMSVQNAILATLFPTLFINSSSIFSIKEGLWILKKFWAIGIFVAIGSFIGTKILIEYPYEFYKLILAFFIIAYLLREKFLFDLKGLIEKNWSIFLICVGLFSGLVGGLVNVLVSVIIIYILELGLEKSASIVLMNFCFLSSKLTQIITFGNAGLLEKESFLLIFYTLVSTLVGFAIGRYFSKKISLQFYRKLLHFTLWFFGIMLIIQYFIANTL